MPQATRSKVAFVCLWLFLFIVGATMLFSLSFDSIRVVEALLALIAAVFGFWSMLA